MPHELTTKWFRLQNSEGYYEQKHDENGFVNGVFPTDSTTELPLPLVEITQQEYETGKQALIDAYRANQSSLKTESESAKLAALTSTGMTEEQARLFL